MGNLQSHDYPDKKRTSVWGTTEFFFELRKYFNDNRGRASYLGTRTITETGTGYLCSNPDVTAISPDFIYKEPIWDDLTKEECKPACLLEKRCEEAFYADY